MKGLDHLVLVTSDLEATGSQLEALGFTVTPQAKHPFGTSNRLVQLDGVFLEYVAITEPDVIREFAGRYFSFAAFNRDFLDRHGAGFAMLVLDSSDADADQARFEASGITGFDRFDFSRKAQQPDGSEATVGFSLAFAERHPSRDAGFFTCQQHAPEYFWKPQYQQHANGAMTISEVVMVVEEPAGHRHFFDAYSGIGAEQRGDAGLEYRTSRGTIIIETPAAFERRFGVAAPETGETARLAGFTVGVRDLDIARETLGRGGAKPAGHEGMLVLDANAGCGAVMAFRQTVPAKAGT